MTDDNLPDAAETIAEVRELFAEGWCICRSATLPDRVLTLLESLSARVTQAETKLATVANLLGKMPIQYAASAKEPVVTLNMIDLTKVIEVAKGETDPSEWVSVPCRNSAKFGHSPHHWSEYREGQIPLRVAHYCDGIEIPAEAPPGTGNEAAHSCDNCSGIDPDSCMFSGSGSEATNG